MSKVNAGEAKNTLHCSFCGKSQREVRKLIAGPTVFICDECVELCMDIMREERVIKMRFGVGDGSEHTLEEVGQSFAVTRERIRQIKAKALRKLRHPSRSRKLRAFLEGRTT